MVIKVGAWDYGKMSFFVFVFVLIGLEGSFIHIYIYIYRLSHINKCLRGLGYLLMDHLKKV